VGWGVRATWVGLFGGLGRRGCGKHPTAMGPQWAGLRAPPHNRGASRVPACRFAALQFAVPYALCCALGLLCVGRGVTEGRAPVCPVLLDTPPPLPSHTRLWRRWWARAPPPCSCSPMGPLCTIATTREIICVRACVKGCRVGHSLCACPPPSPPPRCVALQRLKLRKLLHEYDSTVDRRGGGAPPASAVAPPPVPASSAEPRRQSRLVPGPGAGVGAGPEPSRAEPAPHVVFGSGSGSGAAAPAAVPEGDEDEDDDEEEDGDAGADGADGAARPGGRPKSGGAHVRLNRAARLLASAKGGKEEKKKKVVPIYDWEKRALKREGEVELEDDSDDDLPMIMEQPVLEFQVPTGQGGGGGGKGPCYCCGRQCIAPCAHTHHLYPRGGCCRVA
jgi:hypothetical protein